MDSLIDGTLAEDKDRFKLIHDNIVEYNDEFFIRKDFKRYIEAQDKMDKMFFYKYKWQQKALINIASSGIYVQDRRVSEYNNKIWR